jgi:hypothetical protein
MKALLPAAALALAVLHAAPRVAAAETTPSRDAFETTPSVDAADAPPSTDGVGAGAPASARTEKPRADEHRLPFVAGALHIGLVPWGRGEDKNGCSGACMGFAPDNASYEHAVAFGVGADALFTLFDVLRLGPSLFYVFPNHVDIDGAKGHFGIGSDLGVDLTVEGALSVAPKVRIVPRVQSGATILFPGGELEQWLNLVHSACVDAARGCDTPTAARVGWNVGVGVGALYFLSDRFRLRADVLAQYYSVRMYNVGAPLLGNTIDVSETLFGGRLFFMLGAEY